jgi:hypothetical protein
MQRFVSAPSKNDFKMAHSRFTNTVGADVAAVKAICGLFHSLDSSTKLN